jgi:protein-S-isoprenylcysteine O-methyltransferase Ste14
MTDSDRDIPGLRVPPPLLYAVPLVLGLWFHHLHPYRFLPSILASVLGSMFLALGVVGFAGVWAFRRAGTSPNPWRPSTALVTSGPYRFSRNPMYLGFTFLYVGVSCWANSVWPILALPLILVFMDRNIIAKEEAYLERRFGDSYREYRDRVRRWL